MGLVASKVASWLGGSNDPEINDGRSAMDLMSFVVTDPTNCQALKSGMLQLEKRLRQMDPNKTLPDPMTKVPTPSDTPEHIVLAAWQLGMEIHHRVTGAPKTVRVCEVMVEFLERPFDSHGTPLQMEVPSHVAVGAKIPDWSMPYFQGFTRALALNLMLKSVIELNLSDQQLELIADELRAVLRIHAILMPPMSTAEKVAKSISQKMSKSEVLRQDPIQLLHAFQVRAQADGQQLNSMLLASYIDEFNAMSLLDGKNIYAAEASSMQLLLQVSPEAVEMLAYHWQQYKPHTSGLTVGRLAQLAAEIASSKDGCNELFKGILSPTPQKLEAAITHQIGFYVSKLKAEVGS